ncbi:sodium pump decarboxylase gamma subunit [Clostridium sp. AM16-23]|nr:sodium pump decarboxylase gamma subunit [Clostridium sp. AM16-23]RHO40163.1 sodium pump decarboxylase gamma subunit [Clostridium sp. AM16-23]
MNVNIMLALGIMWQGMLGIFVVMGILALVVYFLTKVGDR